MNILITGSSGRIGSNLALALMNRGHTVVDIDKRPNNRTERIRTLSIDSVDAHICGSAAGAES